MKPKIDFDQGITDAEMWATVDDYQRHQNALRIIQQAAPSVFLTNRARLKLADAFVEHEKRVRAEIAAYVRKHRDHFHCSPTHRNDVLACLDDILSHIEQLESPDTEDKNDQR